MPLVYIILVNYNGYKDTIECVESLRKINFNNYKIIVVDNASTNNSIIHLKKSCNDCTILESKNNLGFAGGNNLAIDYAINKGAEYILLLNNDTLVDPGFLDDMLETYKKEDKIGLVGCKIMNYPKKNIIWYGGGYINWFKFIPEHYGINEVDKGQCDKEKEVDFITGCCMLVKKEVFEKSGLLPDDYFMYFEDVDFCVMVKNSGYKMWYNPKAVIYHKVGLSGGGKESSFSITWGTRNRLVFMKKYKDKVNIVKFIFSKLFYYSTRFIRYFQYISIGKIDNAKAIIEGIKIKI